MKTDMKYAVAVLVDGDNASFENLEDVMGFVSRHGNAIIRRIYGDWTRKPLSGWKDAAGEHGFPGWYRPLPLPPGRTPRTLPWS